MYTEFTYNFWVNSEASPLGIGQANASGAAQLSADFFVELTDQQIKQFQLLYLVKFGVEIGLEDARKLGGDIVDLLGTIWHPITKDESDQLHH